MSKHQNDKTTKPNRPMKTKTGWKVVVRRPSDAASGSVLQSSSAPSHVSREYRVGEWTEPGLWCGPLFLFARREDALAFANIIACDDGPQHEVYRCQWQPWRHGLPRPGGIALAGWGPDARRQGFAAWLGCEDYAACLYARDMPRGRRLARRVRLLEPLAKT